MFGIVKDIKLAKGACKFYGEIHWMAEQSHTMYSNEQEEKLRDIQLTEVKL